MKTPILVINFKNFEGIFEKKAIQLARVAQDVSQRLGVEIVVSPPNPVLSSVTGTLKIPVYAQHVDVEKIGSSTGSVIPELLKSIGVSGAIVNHSEKRVSIQTISDAIERLRDIGLISLVCARTPEEVSRIAKLGPDLLAVEPPELIGSGRSVSKVQPGIITESVKASRNSNPRVHLLCGAGVVSGEDVEIALKLGADGILIASGVVKSTDWKSKIEELARPIKEVNS